MSIEDVKEALFGGIDPAIPGHGGAECAAYLSPKMMLMETLLSTSIMIIVGIFGWFTYTMPSTFPKEAAHNNLKKILLVTLCLVFGLEMGYKLCSKQLLYLLNPCHVITLIQVHARIKYLSLRLYFLDLLAVSKTTQTVLLCSKVSKLFPLQQYCELNLFTACRIMIHYVYGALIAMIAPDTQSRSVS